MLLRLAISVLALSCGVVAQGRLDRGPFLADTGTTSATVWARAGEPGVYRLLVIGEQAREPVRRVDAMARVEHDFCLRWRVAGLRPSTGYGCLVTAADGSVLAGGRLRFATRPEREPARAAVAFACCAEVGPGTDDLWRSLAAARPDAAVLLGDGRRTAAGALAHRAREQRLLDRAPFADLRRQVTTYSAWDARGAPDPAWDGERAVFSDYRGPGVKAGALYRRFRRGPIEVFVLDIGLAGRDPSPFDPERRSLLGQAQWAWLLRGLASSQAAIKCVVTGTSWIGGEAGAWASHPHERQALLDFVARREIGGLVLITGSSGAARTARHATRASAGHDVLEIGPPAVMPVQEHNGAVRHGAEPSFLVLSAESGGERPHLVARWLSIEGEELLRLVPGPPRSKPNFVVLLCDDLGYGDVGCYGNARIHTPNIDRLAGEGIRFTDCYAAAPVCSPARAGLLTGRFPSRAGIYSAIPTRHPMHLRRGETTIAGLLQAAGYATAHVGKWHLNAGLELADQAQPGDLGFEHWFATQANARPTHYRPTNFVRNGRPLAPQDGFACDLVVDEAVRWLSARRLDQRPFFLQVAFHEPHEPISAPPNLVREYARYTATGEAEYYACVSNLDAAIGRFLRSLSQLGFDDDTWVLFTSDNGPEEYMRYPEAWRSHGSTGGLRGDKGALYEGGIRVPGVVRMPGRLHAGLAIEEPISAIDVLPTFCDIAGVDLPADRKIDGTSLLPLLQGKPLRRETPLYWHFFKAVGAPKIAMRQGDWMILGRFDVDWSPPGGMLREGDCESIKRARPVGFELYDLASDPRQQRDLATREPKRLQQMAWLLGLLHADVMAEAPVWDFKPYHVH